MRGVVAVALLLLAQAAVRAEDPVPPLLVRLESSVSSERAAATRALGRIDDERAVPALQRSQKDGAQDVRHEAAVALAKAGRADATTVAILVRSLEEGDWYVRWQACLGLKEAGPRHAEQSVPALAKALADDRADVSREAALALAAIAPEDKRAITALVAAVASGKGDRAAICHAIGMCGPAAADAVPGLVSALKDPGARSRDEAFDALQRVAPKSVPVYAGLLDFPESGVRVLGAWGLGGTQAEGAIPHLCRAFRDEAAEVRAAAARAARSMGPLAKNAIPGLVPLLADEDAHVREVARETITVAGSPQLARLVGRGIWHTEESSFGIVTSRGTVELTTLDPPFGDEEWDALFHEITDRDVGPSILEALSKMKFDHDPQGPLKAILLGKAFRVVHGGPRQVQDTLAPARCAVVLLPYLARDRESAAAALRAASRRPSSRELAERALADLEARK